MLRCPHNPNITCGYLYRESEWHRQLNYSLKYQLHANICKKGECPANPDICVRLAKSLRQR